LLSFPVTTTRQTGCSVAPQPAAPNAPLTEDSDRATVDAVGGIAGARCVSRACVALAWLHSKPVVTAPLVGANTTAQIDEAVTSLDLTADELATLERPYTPRYDWQGVSDEAEMQRIRDQVPGYATV
jgi:aryl-alcohol dehydrogenase-like predicted oxidoreductase